MLQYLFSGTSLEPALVMLHTRFFIIYFKYADQFQLTLTKQEVAQGKLISIYFNKNQKRFLSIPENERLWNSKAQHIYMNLLGSLGTNHFPKAAVSQYTG